MRLGILGGGQLGRMLALAAYPLGIRCTVLDPAPDPCAGQLCDHIAGEYEDYQSLYKLAQASDVITYEFENVPIGTAQWLAERTSVWPPAQALGVCQDRIAEKDFFTQHGIPTPAYRAIHDRTTFDQAVDAIGLPAVIKTRRFGYDGKGQFLIRTRDDIETAWRSLGGRALILEQFITFDREVSIIAVRDHGGRMIHYPLCENEHRDGMLHRTLAPAECTSDELTERAADFADRVLTALNYVGVLAIEFFQVGSRLLANEMAPRVHNSGHWTIDGAVTSQFENHVRAVVGYPLGSVQPLGHCAMLNLIGFEPSFADVLAIPDARLHWYGKSPRPRRKVGHINLCCSSSEQRSELLKRLCDLLNG